MTLAQFRNYEGGNQTLASLKTLINGSSNASVGPTGYYMTDTVGTGWTMGQLIKADPVRYINLVGPDKIYYTFSENSGSSWTDKRLYWYDDNVFFFSSQSSADLPFLQSVFTFISTVNPIYYFLFIDRMAHTMRTAAYINRASTPATGLDITSSYAPFTINLNAITSNITLYIEHTIEAYGKTITWSNDNTSGYGYVAAVDVPAAGLRDNATVTVRCDFMNGIYSNGCKVDSTHIKCLGIQQDFFWY